MTMNRIAIGIFTAAAIALSGAAPSNAQQSGVKRTVLQQVDLSISGREAVTAVAEFQPGASIGRHTHPGEEIGYTLEGTGRLDQEGAPALMLTTGTAYMIPAGKVHDATNTGQTPLRILVTYVVEKGKPLATPAK
jgi:quercetin dioxygenase-like cupin family protein